MGQIAHSWPPEWLIQSSPPPIEGHHRQLDNQCKDPMDKTKDCRVGQLTNFLGTSSLKFVSFAYNNCNMVNLFFWSVFRNAKRAFGGNFYSQQWPFLLVLISGAILTTQICHADAFHPGLSDGYDKIIYQRQYVLTRIFRTRFHLYVLIFTSAEQEQEIFGGGK